MSRRLLAALHADLKPPREPGPGPDRAASIGARVLATAWACLAITWTGVAGAETPAGDAAATRPVEVLVVTAARAPRPLADVPNATSVLDAAMLETTISTSVDDALRFVPGLQLTREGGRGGRAQLSLRGLDPNHVVVLVDGIRLNDPTNARGGSFDPTTLALVDIERIEIVRGPRSATFGSDALAGAINVITRRVGPDAPLRTHVRGRGGRFHTGSVAGEASAGLRGIAGLSLGAAFDTFRDPNSDGGYDGASLKARLEATLPFAVELDATTRIHESSARGFPESSGGPELATLRTMEDRRVREILAGVGLGRRFGEILRVDLRASRVARREDLTSPGIDPVLPFDPFADVPPSRAGDEYTRWDFSFVTDWTPPAWAIGGLALDTRVIAGVDGVVEHGESDTYLDFTGTGSGPFTPAGFFDRRRTLGLFAELEQDVGPWLTLSGGLRFDSTPDQRDRVAPSVGVTVDVPGTAVRLFGHYGEGFKRPSFYALRNPLVGDPTLAVEKSRGFEIGLRAATSDDRLRVQLGYFELRVRDVIVFDATRFALANAGQLLSRGVELELEGRVTRGLDVRGGLTWNPTDLRGSPATPPNRSTWRGYAGLAWTPHPLVELDLRALAVGPSKTTSFQTGAAEKTLAGYLRLDLRTTWRVRTGIDLFLEIENLTNRTYREAIGFEAPGIAPRAGAALHF
ncbi:MAG: TonB-dependent receptor [Spirochaetaceae bacterium]|nr:TonB-dependent receptor [Myxococcales bacterium]MCB9725744.1 TonB-dependent receptor [Spirochaetaceae bacterium]